MKTQLFTEEALAGQNYGDFHFVTPCLVHLHELIIHKKTLEEMSSKSPYEGLIPFFSEDSFLSWRASRVEIH